KDIIDMGESLGTGVAGYIASHRDPGAILLVSGMTSIIDAGKSKIMWLNLYPDSVFPQPTFDNLSIARGKHAPLLLVHGEADNLLTCDFSRRMFSEGSQPKQLLIVKNTGHNDMFKDENMAPLAKALQTWIAQIDNLQKINQSLSSAALK
ncbi:MAG TPA: alpha/beta hydrolase, partial [Chroococcales cyanobacterium]